jgi:hypothetical protein
VALRFGSTGNRELNGESIVLASLVRLLGVASVKKPINAGRERALESTGPRTTHVDAAVYVKVLTKSVDRP